MRSAIKGPDKNNRKTIKTKKLSFKQIPHTATNENH